MQLVGQPVKHILFGKGVIAEQTDRMLTVDFPQGEKRFLYPDAFSKYLTLKDSEDQKKLIQRCRQNKTEEKELRLEKQKKLAHLEQLHSIKAAPQSQAAFDIKEQDLDKIMEQAELSAGFYISGPDKGKPKTAEKIKPNTSCLLTYIPEGGKEKDRKIAAMMMTDENFYGKQVHNGVILCHKKYQLKFPKGFTLSYWDYMLDPGKKPAWGRVSFKYLDNKTVQRMLEDMEKKFEGKDFAKEIRTFYQYYCELNHLAQVE